MSLLGWWNAKLPAPYDKRPGDGFLAQPIPASAVAASTRAVQSYQADRVRWAEHRARTGMRFGVGGLIAAICACSAVAVLMPLHTTEWRVIEADKSTGVAFDLPPFDEAVRNAPKGFDLWFAERYVQAQEDWVYDERYRNRGVVTYSSVRDVSANYEWKISGKNPDGVASSVGQKGTINTHIVSSDIDTNKETGRSIATVRFWRREQLDGANPGPLEHLTATVVFEKHPELIPAAARRVNPLGIVVLRYHSERDELVGKEASAR